MASIGFWHWPLSFANTIIATSCDSWTKKQLELEAVHNKIDELISIQ